MSASAGVAASGVEGRPTHHHVAPKAGQVRVRARHGVLRKAEDANGVDARHGSRVGWQRVDGALNHDHTAKEADLRLMGGGVVEIGS